MHVHTRVRAPLVAFFLWHFAGVVAARRSRGRRGRSDDDHPSVVLTETKFSTRLFIVPTQTTRTVLNLPLWRPALSNFHTISGNPRRLKSRSLLNSRRRSYLRTIHSVNHRYLHSVAAATLSSMMHQTQLFFPANFLFPAVYFLPLPGAGACVMVVGRWH